VRRVGDSRGRAAEAMPLAQVLKVQHNVFAALYVSQLDSRQKGEA